MVNKILSNNADIFEWREIQNHEAVEPWKPEPLNHVDWPPDYRAVYAWRMKQLKVLNSDPEMLKSAKAYYSTRPKEFIMHWVDTYNPRKKNQKWMPFVFFERQADFIDFIDQMRNQGESGLVEKCRDAGATWGACAYSIHSFLFIDNDAIGWGSRKQDLVDKLGNPDSIFEKMRLILRKLPKCFLPSKFDTTFMRFINHDNKSVIMGEAGDNIGRGGRTSIYFKDESAHYERPELIEAALGDNTNTQIDISSVNGLGNVFHRRREAGLEWFQDREIEPGYVSVFVIDYKDHPEKDEQWFKERKAKAIREGMQHVFAQEVERNYAASVSNNIIDYEWIQAAVDAIDKIVWRDEKGIIHKGLSPEQIGNNFIGGLDVADGDGKDNAVDRNASAIRQDIILRDVKEWGERDPGVTTRKMIEHCENYKGIVVQYDSIGVGSGVKTEYNRLKDEELIDFEKLRLVPWNAGSAVVDPFETAIPDDDESILNKDLFHNMKAQAWWSLRTRFYKTFQNITHGVIYPIEELISLDGNMVLLQQLMKELAQPTSVKSTSLKILVDKKPDGTKSPNLADAVVMAFFPIDESKGNAITGKQSG